MKNTIIILVLSALLLSSCGIQDLTGQNPGTAEPTTVQDDTTAPFTTADETTEPDTGIVAGSVSDYFPFEANVFTEYAGSGNEYAPYISYVDYIRDNKMQTREFNGGTGVVSVYTIRDGELVRTLRRGGIEYKHEFSSAASEINDVLLKEPIKEGTSWTTEEGLTRKITAVNKSIQVPAGIFSAVEVTTYREDSTDMQYYVKGMGLIKSEYISKDKTMHVISELESIGKDVPFKEMMRVYFPQFNSDRIVYIDREFEIKTNESMKYKFQKELKVIPDGSDLAKVLTKNTQVLSISVDEDKDTVTVDLSSDFIKEMNAGSSLEAMLLKCVAYTFGGYYQKGNVIILIDGKPYESGHILMKEGESIKVDTEDIAAYK
jgi:hypothetical protein